VAFCEARLDGVDEKNDVEVCSQFGVGQPSEPENAYEADPDYVPDEDTYAPTGDGDQDGTPDETEREIEDALEEACSSGATSAC
jgi:hypothetical protein